MAAMTKVENFDLSKQQADGNWEVDYSDIRKVPLHGEEVSYPIIMAIWM